MRGVDVAIIGAGAAGIGAGLALQRLGVSFVVLEARSRIGGRAFTDTVGAGHLWDQGCHWLHSADQNPLTTLADRLGVTYATRKIDGWPIVRGCTWLDDAQSGAGWAVVDRALAAIVQAGVSGTGDDAAASAAGEPGEWWPLVRHWIELMTSGDPHDVSARDYARQNDTEVDYPVTGGYGALVARLGSALPVACSSAVRNVTRTGQGLRLHLDDDELDVRAVICTAPTNVVAQQELDLSGVVPGDVLALFGDVRCGFYEKVVLAFEADVFGGYDLPYLDVLDAAGGVSVNFQIRPGGQPIAIGHLAGDGVRALVVDGPAALIETVTDRLACAFGPSIKSGVAVAKATGWTADPFARGAYSFARPGKSASRDRLIEADVAPIFLAGEVFSPNAHATCHGAWLSGLEAAHKAARFLGHADVAPDPLWLPADLA